MDRCTVIIGVALSALLLAGNGYADEPTYWGFDKSQFHCDTSDGSVSIEEAMFIVAEGAYCKWDLAKIEFVAKMPQSEIATQKVGDYIIYLSRYFRRAQLQRYNPFRSQFAMLDDPSHPVEEGDDLPLGRYRLVRVVSFEKANGFPMDIPLLERIAFPQN
jgi:hypothetical protein